MKFNLIDILRKELVGKILTGLEYGINEAGCQSATIPQKIVMAHLGTDESREKGVIWLRLENGENVYFSDCENVEIE